MLRLALLLLCVGLATSRVGLLLHEVIGHGGVAVALGGELRQVELFWFGGGWVRTSAPAGAWPSLAVQLGGIFVELVVAIALWPAARRWRGTRRGELAMLGSSLFLAHGLWYAATGIWHGFGDGAILHARLGWARYPTALALSAALCFVAAVAARGLCKAMAPALGGSWRRRLVTVLAAAGLAGAGHAALAYGEVRVRRDETYRLTMRTAEQRTQDERLAALAQELRRRGVLVVRREELLRARPAPPRPFPFAQVLAAAALACVLAGAWTLRRAPSADDDAAPLARSSLAWAAAVALASVLAVAITGVW